MPSYSRRRYGRRSFRRSRRGFASSRFTQLPLKTVPAHNKAAVHVFPAQENVVSSALHSASPLIHLNVVPRGSGSAERIGSRYKMRYLFVNYAINPPSALTVQYRTVRLAVVYDMRPTAVLPTIGEIFGASDPLYNVRLDATDRFKVLYVKNHVILKSPVAANNYEWGPASWKHGKLKIPIFRETNMTAADTSGAFSNCLTGNLYLLCNTAFVTAASSDPFIYFTYRISFVDVV